MLLSSASLSLILCVVSSVLCGAGASFIRLGFLSTPRIPTSPPSPPPLATTTRHIPVPLSLRFIVSWSLRPAGSNRLLLLLLLLLLVKRDDNDHSRRRRRYSRLEWTGLVFSASCFELKFLFFSSSFLFHLFENSVGVRSPFSWPRFPSTNDRRVKLLCWIFNFGIIRAKKKKKKNPIYPPSLAGPATLEIAARPPQFA